MEKMLVSNIHVWLQVEITNPATPRFTFAALTTSMWSNWRGDTHEATPALPHAFTQIPKKYEDYPLVICYIAIEHGPVEIVDFPIKNGDFP